MVKPLPTFLVIGAEKSGTTALADALNRHESIHVPAEKELRFFSSHNWHRGLEWYSAQFTPDPGVTCIGEASPAYTLFPVEPNVVGRVRTTLGDDIRFVYIVRNPVERLVSHYLHALTYGWVPSSVSVATALEQSPLLLAASMYHTQYQRYVDYYPATSVRVLLFEDMVDEGAVPRDLLTFLGVGECDVPVEPANVTTDRGGLPGRLARVKPLVRRAVPHRVRGELRAVSSRIERPLPDRDRVRQDVLGLGVLEVLRREAGDLGSAIGLDLVDRWKLGQP